MHFNKFYSLSSGNVSATYKDSSTDNRSQSYTTIIRKIMIKSAIYQTYTKQT